MDKNQQRKVKINMLIEIKDNCCISPKHVIQLELVTVGAGNYKVYIHMINGNKIRVSDNNSSFGKAIDCFMAVHARINSAIHHEAEILSLEVNNNETV